MKPPKRFDPFTDRAARDIRNHLSTGFIQALRENDPGRIEQIAKKCIADQPLELYHGYIRKRLDRYQQVMRHLRQSAVKVPLGQATALWNAELFFEVHELLEESFRVARNPLKQGLKGLIQAAGVYIHLEHGHHRAARGLARRALLHLTRAGFAVNDFVDVKMLMEKLSHLDPKPPRLGPSAERNP
jgi:hypothetical protein